MFSSVKIVGFRGRITRFDPVQHRQHRLFGRRQLFTAEPVLHHDVGKQLPVNAMSESGIGRFQYHPVKSAARQAIPVFLFFRTQGGQRLPDRAGYGAVIRQGSAWRRLASPSLGGKQTGQAVSDGYPPLIGHLLHPDAKRGIIDPPRIALIPVVESAFVAG